MSSPTEIQALLRFLSQDAKVPLSAAMASIKDLRKANMNSPDAIAKSDVQTLRSTFKDEKLSKQILSAARRASKKRTSTSADPSSPQSHTKRSKGSTDASANPITPEALEDSLALPRTVTAEDEISKTILYTNRAPLVLAFAVVLLKYTMPEQPLSSRLSLAQAVVSVNSRSKAVSLGLESGRSASDEGWGQGQPVVKVMGREVTVLKRWGYDRKMEEAMQDPTDLDPADTSSAIPQTGSAPALWGLDLEALRSSNGSEAVNSPLAGGTGLPIYTAQSARAYLLKSFNTALAPGDMATPSTRPAKKKPYAVIAQERERNLGLVLGALELLYSSWTGHIASQELDRRSSQWYLAVRPDVDTGVAGWGGKGEVHLRRILDLRRKE
ncbi:MAG: hypothetical protein M1832_001624 [Thelocarpon impressellum]|nr:MAG: hypothetical protein M1832_001624 [Thelocarpon impressellum]